MTARSGFSQQTLSVLAALCAQPSQWQHGYALARQTSLKSGTLYPILIRLAERGLVEAQWQDEPQPGRPRRHLYRLTASGLAAAAEALSAASAEAAAAAAKASTAPSARRSRPGVPSGRSITVRGAGAPGVNAAPVPWAGVPWAG